MFHEAHLNNSHYEDCYFSYDEGLAEAHYVFVDGNGFPARWKDRAVITVGETGYGTGLNLIALLQSVPEGWVGDIRFISVEKYLLSPERIAELLESFHRDLGEAGLASLKAWAEQYPSLSEGWNRWRFSFRDAIVEVQLYHGDVLDMLSSLNTPVDCWFLDGHSPDKNPDMWCEEVFNGLAKASCLDGTTVATFSAAGIVKRGLRAAGFAIKRRKGFGRKRHMVQGVYKGAECDTAQ